MPKRFDLESATQLSVKSTDSLREAILKIWKFNPGLENNCSGTLTQAIVAYAEMLSNPSRSAVPAIAQRAEPVAVVDDQPFVYPEEDTDSSQSDMDWGDDLP